MPVRRIPRDEAGLTLTELLVSITITAIIGTVVAQVFLLTLKLGPETTARNKFATDVSFAVDKLSDDVANATAQPTSVAPDPYCELTITNATNITELGTFATPNGSARWFLEVSNPTGTPATLYVEKLWRQFGGTSQVMLNGYCTRNTFVISVTTPDTAGYAFDLNILPSTKEAQRTVSFRGDRRMLPPPS